MTRADPLVAGLPEGASARRSKERLAAVIRRYPFGVLACVVLALMLVAGWMAPLIAPDDPLALHAGHQLEGPSMRFWFGTDSITRDVLSRILFGLRYSATISVIAVTISVTTGTFVGLVTGYAGGWLDLLAQRVIDIIQTVPGLMLALVVVGLFGTSSTVTVSVIAITALPSSARVLRGAVAQTRSMSFVESATVIGCTHPRIILRHVLPNVLAPITVMLSLGLGGAMLVEASLSFLGMGVQAPAPSLGGMLSGDGRRYLEQQPWLAIFPGATISLFILAANSVGDFLRDVLDPRLRGK